MEPWLTTAYGNASSTHTMGYEARTAIDAARATVATVLNCSPQEVIFTAGGTESVNIALFGAARQFGTGHILTTAIEHPAVLDTCRALEQEGFELTIVLPQANGVVSPHAIGETLKQETVLVSVMYANNEVGTVQQITEIQKLVREKSPAALFHVDACQGSGALHLDVQKLGVDLLSINASKIYGPKGVGALYIKKGVTLKPLLFGGGQERGLRPGTENVAGIVGFATALELAESDRDDEYSRLTDLRTHFIERMKEVVPSAQLNGDKVQRLPNNVNLYFPGVDGQTLLIHLDQEGIQASLGSACAAGTVDPSHVLLAMGRSKKEAMSSIRFSMGRETTLEQVEQVVAVLDRVVKKLKA